MVLALDIVKDHLGFILVGMLLLRWRTLIAVLLVLLVLSVYILLDELVFWNWRENFAALVSSSILVRN